MSLWDLKRKSKSRWRTTKAFELCPYGIWNKASVDCLLDCSTFELCPYGIWNRGSELIALRWNDDLNFVPMGFETEFSFVLWFSSYWIWTLSLWDLKLFVRKVSCYLRHTFELCPYGIWNQKKFVSFKYAKTIWTLSLWDLKL